MGFVISGVDQIHYAYRIYIYNYISSHGVFLSDPSNPTATTINNQQQPTTQPPNHPPNQPNHPTTQPPHRFQQLIIKTYVGIPRFSAWTNFGACDPVTLQRWNATCVVSAGGMRKTRPQKKRCGWWGKNVLLLGGGFKYFLFSPLFGEDFQFD